jgi:nitronate monooxygenase
MPVPAPLVDRLVLPLIGAPMFIASYPELVIAQCKAGVLGTFPTLNARSIDILEEWVTRIAGELAAHAAAHPGTRVAPYGVNLILHASNRRLDEDLALVSRHRVPLVITSVGKPDRVCQRVHAYGGLVFHDVISVKHARKALECGVDGLILVCAGAGGHAGTLSPFALLGEVREFWDGPVVLAGSLGSGAALRAAEVMGADFGYMGTRFIATREANAPEEQKQMMLRSAAADIVYTPVFSGIKANYLRGSIERAGLDPDRLEPGAGPGTDLFDPGKSDAKAWKDIWSAGHGVGTIHDVPTVAELVARLRAEYAAAVALPSAFVGARP